MDNFMWIMAYDGDNAGRLVGRAILSNDPATLSEVSLRINLGHEVVQKWALEHGGAAISGGGDEGTFQVPHEALEAIEQLRADYHFATQLTMTIGVGKTLSEAGKSLIVGKFRGKNQVVMYDPTIEQEIQKVQANLEQGTATQEEKKQGEAYLQPEVQGMNNAEQPPMNQMVSSEHDCPYCQEMASQNIHEDCPYCAQAGSHDPMAEGHADDCPYCAVMAHDPMADGHTDDCPYCQEMSAHDPMADGHPEDCPYCARSHDPSAEGHPEDCPYCAQSAAQSDGGNDQVIDPNAPPSNVLPTTQDSQNYAGQGLPPPPDDKPAAISAQPSGIAAPTDSKTNQNIILENEQGGGAAQEYENQINQIAPPLDSQTNEGVQDVISEIDALPPNENAPREQVNTADAADMAPGTNMEGNVSRPESYSQDVPTDLGMGQQPDNGRPDITSVLQEGLDNHADNIQRERVVEMVGQALAGFKASKMILERAKTEAPQLYESSIAMLKAMIEMAKMLGLDQEQAAAPSGVLEGQPAEQPGSPVAQQGDPNAVPQGDPSVSDGHPNYNNLFPTHQDAGGAGDPNDPKLLGQSANR